MIIRRLAEGVKTQDWFVVGVEIMVVVIGIFIGLQVDDWNETRKERKLTDEAINALHEEILGLEHSRAIVRDFLEQKYERLLIARPKVFGLKDESLSPRECMAIMESFQIIGIPDNIPILEEVMARSSSAAGTNEEIRGSIQSFVQKRESIRSLISASVGSTINLGHFYPNLIHYSLISDEKEISTPDGFDRRAICNLDAMKENKGFRNDLTQNISLFKRYFDMSVDLVGVELATLHRLVDRELAINHGEEVK